MTKMISLVRTMCVTAIVSLLTQSVWAGTIPAPDYSHTMDSDTMTASTKLGGATAISFVNSDGDWATGRATYTAVRNSSTDKAMALAGNVTPYNQGSIAGSGSFSFLTVAKLVSTTSPRVIASIGNASHSGGNAGVTLVYQNGYIKLLNWKKNTGVSALVNQAIEGAEDSYHSYLVTYNKSSASGTSSTLTLFVDGVKVGETMNVAYEPQVTGYQLGGIFGGTNQISVDNTACAKGEGFMIDEIALWKSDVSSVAADIAALYPVWPKISKEINVSANTNASDLTELASIAENEEYAIVIASGVKLTLDALLPGFATIKGEGTLHVPAETSATLKNAAVSATVLVEGTLTTEGIVSMSGSNKFDSGSILSVSDGVTTISKTRNGNSSYGDSRGLMGTITIEKDATLALNCGDAINYSADASHKTVLNVKGTLDCGNRRQSFKANNIVNLYVGGAIIGTGDGNAALDFTNGGNGDTIHIVDDETVNTKVATIAAVIRANAAAGKITLDVPAGLTAAITGHFKQGNLLIPAGVVQVTNKESFNGRSYTIGDTGVLEITSSSTMDISGYNLSGITGTGTIRFVGTNWVTLPNAANKAFATSLLVVNNNSDGLIVTAWNAADDNTVSTIGTLTGSGNFRSDWGGKDGDKKRSLKVVQSADTEWSGKFIEGDRVKAFIVAGGADATAKTLTLSGVQTATNDLTIEESGSAKLTGTWIADTVTVGGRLEVLDSATLTKTTLTSAGSLKTANSTVYFGSDALASAEAVAKVGATYYATVADAVAAANTGTEITLINNSTGNFSINDNKTITIIGGADADHVVSLGTITVASGSKLNTKGYLSFTLTSNGEVEIVDGQATVSRSSEQSIKGTLTIDADATFVSATGDSISWTANQPSTINVYGTLAMGSHRWTVGSSDKINLYGGCSVAGDGDASSVFDLYHSGEVIAVHKVENKATVVEVAAIRTRNNQAEVNVEDGMTLKITSKIDRNSSEGSTLIKTGAGEMVVSGTVANGVEIKLAAGTIQTTAAATVTTDVEGKMVVGDGSATTPYALATIVAKIGTTPYASVQDAIAHLGDGETITLVDTTAELPAGWTTVTKDGVVTIRQKGDIYYVSGYMGTPAEEKDAAKFVAENGGATALLDGDTIVINSTASGNEVWVASDFAGKKFSIAKNFAIHAGANQTSLLNDAVIDVVDDVTLTISQTSTQKVALGSVTINGAVSVTTDITATEISGTCTITLADEKSITITTKGDDVNIVPASDNHKIVIDGTTYTSTIKTYTVNLKTFDNTTCLVKVNDGEEFTFTETFTVNHGDKVVFRYVANEGYEITAGSGKFKYSTVTQAITPTTGTINVTVAKLTYTITITPVEHTTVTVDGVAYTESTKTVEYGSNVTIKYTADETYELVGEGTFELTNITENKTVGADLTTQLAGVKLAIPVIDHATATVTIGGVAATIAEDGTVLAPIGSKVIVKYTADAGYYAPSKSVTIASVAADSEVVISGYAPVTATIESTEADGTKGYFVSLSGTSGALAKCKTGATVKLLTDVTETTRANLGTSMRKDYAVTLDLNGHTLTISNNPATQRSFLVTYGCKLTVMNGTVTSTQDDIFSVTGSGSSLTLESDVIVKTDVAGKVGIVVGDGATVVVKGTITTKNAAISTNAAYTNDLTIESTAKITSSDSSAIYKTSKGSFTVKSGAQILAHFAPVECRGGNLVIEDGATLTVTGEGTDTIPPKNGISASVFHQVVLVNGSGYTRGTIAVPTSFDVFAYDLDGTANSYAAIDTNKDDIYDAIIPIVITEEDVEATETEIAVTKPDGADSVEVTTDKGAAIAENKIPFETGVYTITAKKGETVVATETLGVIAAKDAEVGQTPDRVTTAVAVPFTGATVANLLNTTLLKEGDTLTAQGKTWTLDANKTWIGTYDATTALARGTAVWVMTAGKIVVLGKYDDNTEIAAPTEKETYLLANPKMKPYTPSVKAGDAQDQIVTIGITEKPVRYTKKNGKWTTPKPTGIKIPGTDIEFTADAEENPEIPVGKGFWFIKK